jgi:hypothetical protein
MDGAFPPIALRVGDDATARVAYASRTGIRFGTVDGSRFSTRTLPGTARGWGPILVLEPGNVADVLWNSSPGGIIGGCVDGEPLPDDGTWFSTNAGGTWTSTRISKSIGAESLTIDPTRGDVLAVVSDGAGMTLFRKASGGWSHETLSTSEVGSGSLRVNPVTGAIALAYVVYPDAGPNHVRVRIRA